jgi:hypothetical protein
MGVEDARKGRKDNYSLPVRLCTGTVGELPDGLVH